MIATAGRVAPGCHDASCVLVVKLNSATRLSLLAGQPKPTRASLLAKVPGTAVRCPLVADATSSCMASAPSSPGYPEFTCRARKPPLGLKPRLAAECAA